MSVQATTWVWEHSQAEGNARLVLLAIADGANREGLRSCQSVPTIAAMCRLSERTVHRKIVDLENTGELVKSGRSGQYGTQIYDLPLVSGVKLSPPDKTGQTTCQNDPDDLTPMSANPINPSTSKEVHPMRDARENTHTKTNQGTRLSEDFFPAQKHIDKIRQLKPGLNLDIEHEKFKNYWLSKTGTNATKLDWGRTWENWMLNAKQDPNTQLPSWARRTQANLRMTQARQQARQQTTQNPTNDWQTELAAQHAKEITP